MRLLGGVLMVAGGLVALIFGLGVLLFSGFALWSVAIHHPRTSLVTLPQFLMLLAAYGGVPFLAGLGVFLWGRRLRGA